MVPLQDGKENTTAKGGAAGLSDEDAALLNGADFEGDGGGGAGGPPMPKTGKSTQAAAPTVSKRDALRAKKAQQALNATGGGGASGNKRTSTKPQADSSDEEKDAEEDSSDEEEADKGTKKREAKKPEAKKREAKKREAKKREDSASNGEVPHPPHPPAPKKQKQTRLTPKVSLMELPLDHALLAAPPVGEPLSEQNAGGRFVLVPASQFGSEGIGGWAAKIKAVAKTKNNDFLATLQFKDADGASSTHYFKLAYVQETFKPLT